MNVSSNKVLIIDNVLLYTNDETECYDLYNAIHAVESSQTVHFSAGENVSCTAFSMVSLKADRYTMRAEVVLPLPVDSPSVNTTDSATLVVYES